jgi:hypothetical protein
VVEYGRRQITIQERRGKIYVNDRLLSNFTEVQQQMLPKVVAHFEKARIEDEKDFEKWMAQLRGAPRTYVVEGVVLELENGDQHGVPFFFFSAADLNVLQPGWQQWLAAEKDAERSEMARAQQERESLLLQSAAEAYQRQQEQELALMELDLLATSAGATDLWEVHLRPRPGVAAYARTVIVPGRNSGDAKRIALERYPGYIAGSISQVNDSWSDFNF